MSADDKTESMPTEEERIEESRQMFRKLSNPDGLVARLAARGRTLPPPGPKEVEHIDGARRWFPEIHARFKKFFDK